MHHHALPGIEARSDQDTFAVKRLHANRPRLETFCRDVFEHDILATRTADKGVSRYCNSLLLLVCRREHRHELPCAQSRCMVLDRKMDRDRLIAIGKSRTSVRQIQSLTANSSRGTLHSCKRFVAKRLHPQTSWVDDMEHDRVRLRDLTGHRRSIGNDTIHRRERALRILVGLCLMTRAAP